MKRYIVVEPATKRIVKTGRCSDRDFELQAGPGQLVLEGEADDLTQKYVNGKIVDKTPSEIAASKPPVIPEGQKPAAITNDELKAMQDKLEKLESKIK